MDCQGRLLEKMALELRLKNKENKGCKIPNNSDMARLKACVMQNHFGEVSKSQIMHAVVSFLLIVIESHWGVLSRGERESDEF